MAKQAPSTSRQASALLDDEEDEVYLRPPQPPRRRSRKAQDDAETDELENYLRARKRISPRRAGLLRRMLGNAAGRWVLGIALLAVLAALGVAAWQIRQFFLTDPHFRIDSSAQIETVGNQEFTRSQVIDVFGSDIGRNIFRVPLATREAALLAEPWVAGATVMRLLPATLRIHITERVPVAFARVGRQVELVDANGVLLSMAPAALAAHHYSFPVVTGLDPAASAQARADRMQLYSRFISALNAGGQTRTALLSEVDLSDLDDIRAVVPAQGTDILLHFGDSDFLPRLESFQEHIADWRRQYPNLSAVDLRYDRQVVLKMADAAQADEAAEAKPVTDGGAATFAVAPEAASTGNAPAAAVHRSTAAVHRAAAPRTASAQVRHSHSAKKPKKKWMPHFIPGAGRGM